ncbi:unnamed protein product [Mytilus edulis]|uniref:Uncharacterized protein n=1 Tax=Mytilus edulis TaxID=6550 RepID=A0A8S3T6X6_MYTED|nr:unnamed protein product [Mytilus edulis]
MVDPFQKSSSVKVEMMSLTTSIYKIQATVNAKFIECGNRLDLMHVMESLGLSPDPPQDPPRPRRHLVEDDSVSFNPRSQEGNTVGDALIAKEPSSCNSSGCLRSLYILFLGICQPICVHILMGWGAYLEGRTASGLWSGAQLEEHINLLEMRAVFISILQSPVRKFQ